MSFAAFSLLLLSILFAAPLCETKRLRIAFAMDGELWDFGWTFNNNLARITMMETLMKKYPNDSVSHVFGFLSDSWTEECDPQFEVWCRSGVDLVIAAGIGQQYCVARLAKLYPNITFVGAAASTTGPPNYANIFVRLYQPAYLAGYTAGLMTKAKKICISTTLPIPAAMLDISAFSRGIRNADSSVQIHVFCTGQMRYPLLEVWIVNQSYALGCDVVWVQSLVVDGSQRAQDLGLMSVGLFSDARQTVGEGVITSIVVNMAPAFLRAAEAVLNGTFLQETQKPDWWMDWS